MDYGPHTINKHNIETLKFARKTSTFYLQALGSLVCFPAPMTPVLIIYQG